MNKVFVYAVIGGYNYEGEDFNSLRLFDCKSTAEKYKNLLVEVDGCDYAKIKIMQVDMHSVYAV